MSAIRPGETREEWGRRVREEVNSRIRAIPRIKRAYERGDSDAYYGRRDTRPHIWNDGTGREVITEDQMTPDEIAAYWRGYDENPSDRKDWR